MIAIIDYGMGNLRSVQKAFEAVGHPARVTRRHAEIEKATHLVLPGVGAFPAGMENLRRFHLEKAIYEALGQGKPLLGICLGLQLLFSESEEFGRHQGLGLIKGRVVGFPPDRRIKVPHVGWNQIRITREAPPLAGIPDGTFFYFVHSYCVVPEEEGVISTTTLYGEEFVSSIWTGQIFACQFHPEKSQEAGLTLLNLFGKIRI